MMTGQHALAPSSAATKKTAAPLLSINEKAFAENFNRRPFLIQHQLSDHPLFDISRLMKLAQALPESHVEYNAGTVDISCKPNETPRTGLSVEETIRRIEECKSWMVLKNVEHDSDYAALLDECLAEVQEYSDKICPGLSNSEAFIFLSSPGSVTPYHMDPEHNFLLQIRGKKFMTVFDRSLTSAEEFEKFHAGAHRNMHFEDEYLQKSAAFELLPGLGLHVPVCAPHFVRNGSNVSVSFSITFRTPHIETEKLVHLANGRLRQFGLHPSPVGSNTSIDALKVMAFRVLRKSRSLLGGKA